MLWRFSQNDLHGGFLLRNICNKVCIRAFEEGRICPSLGRPCCRRGLYSCREGAFSIKCQSTNEFRVSLSANDALIHTGDSLCWDQTQRTKARTDLSGFIEAAHAGVSRIIFPRPSICQLLSFLVFSWLLSFLFVFFKSKRLANFKKNSWRKLVGRSTFVAVPIDSCGLPWRIANMQQWQRLRSTRHRPGGSGRLATERQPACVECSSHPKRRPM